MVTVQRKYQDHDDFSSNVVNTITLSNMTTNNINDTCSSFTRGEVDQDEVVAQVDTGDDAVPDLVAVKRW